MRPLGITLRPYITSDREGCSGLFVSNVPTYFAASELPDFNHFLALPKAHLLVAEVSDRLVGCGGYYVSDSGVGRLCWGMVHHDHHRQGIGTILLQVRLEALFAGEAVADVGIDTSQHSAAFFQRFGFGMVNQVSNGIAPGLDLVSMRLSRAAWEQHAESLAHGTAGIAIYPN